MESRKEQALSQIKKQLEATEEALKMLEGQMKEPPTIGQQIKLFIAGLIPMRKKHYFVIQDELSQLSYSILAVQKQFLAFVYAVNKGKENELEKYNDGGHGVYE